MNITPTIIFDVYGTLFWNDVGRWLETFRDICEEQAFMVDVKHLWLEWKFREGNFRNGRVNLAQPNITVDFKSYYQAWKDAFQDTFHALELHTGDADRASQMCVEALSKRPPFSDTLYVLDRLRLRGWRVGILSNADDAFLYPLVRHYGLDVDVVLSSETAQVYKPHPEAFLQVCRLMQVNPAQAVYVGDSQFDDVHGSKLVGMHSVWLNRNGVSRDEGLLAPDDEIRSLSELEEKLGTN